MIRNYFKGSELIELLSNSQLHKDDIIEVVSDEGLVVMTCQVYEDSDCYQWLETISDVKNYETTNSIFTNKSFLFRIVE